MKRLIMTLIAMSLLFAAPLAMARGNTVRATLDRIWQKEQARQERIDRDLSNISKDLHPGQSGFLGFQGTSAPVQLPRN